MSAKQSLTDAGFRTLNIFHQFVVRATHGRVGRRAFGMPVVELRTIGRTTGRTRATLLTAPVVEEGRVILVASKGGDDRDPDWFKNIEAHPDVELTLNGERRAMRARRASEDEAALLWPKVVSIYKPYATYRRRAARAIPLVVCEPR